MKKSKIKTDWWSEITVEERNAIDKGIVDIKAGRVKPLKDVRNLYEKWF